MVPNYISLKVFFLYKQMLITYNLQWILPPVTKCLFCSSYLTTDKEGVETPLNVVLHDIGKIIQKTLNWCFIYLQEIPMIIIISKFQLSVKYSKNNLFLDGPHLAAKMTLREIFVMKDCTVTQKWGEGRNS